MTALANLQRKFQAYVLDQAANDQFDRAVVGGPHVDSRTRLGVYAYAYRARLVEVLGNDFHGLHALAGAGKFDALAHAYVEATPSTHYNVRWYGARFADFIRATPPWSDIEAFAEMAQLEWTLGLSFDAPDQTHVRSADLAKLAPEQWPHLRLRLHPAVHRLHLRWNVGAIRRALDREEPLPALIKFDQAKTWIVSRRGTAVRHRAAERDEAAALDAVERGASFADICEVLCQWHANDAVAMHAATLLKQWIHDHWITEFLLAE